MNNIISHHSKSRDIHNAFREVTSKSPSNPALIIFFSSTIYDFEKLTKLFVEKYPESEVVGLTTTGEIGPDGLSDNGLSIITFTSAAGKVKAVLMEDIEKYPVFYRNELKNAANQVGINVNGQHPEKEGIGLVFPNGLIGAEEKMLSIANSIFDNDGFSYFGGTAGDDYKFVQTSVSLNGKVSNKGGIVVYMKPRSDFYIIKENIFQSKNVEMQVTKVDTEARIVYEFDGRPATSVYAERLNVPEKDLSKHFLTHPIGRKVNDEIYIASPFAVLPNGAIQFYCQIFSDTKVEILEPKDPVQALKDTLYHLNDHLSNVEGAFAINCILRKLQFKEQNLYPVLNQELSKIPNLAGFVSYGEQLNKTQINQTLILLAFGTRK